MYHIDRASETFNDDINSIGEKYMTDVRTDTLDDDSDGRSTLVGSPDGIEGGANATKKEMMKRLIDDLSFRILSGVVVEHGARFVPNAFQLFPARYVDGFIIEGDKVLCIDYDMGTGKTLTAALAISRLLSDTMRIEGELRRTGRQELITQLPRPYIVGNWSSVEAFEDELMQPSFGIISLDEYEELLKNRASGESGNEESQARYAKIRAALARRISKYVRMASYQKMFNRYFRGVASLAVKDEPSLLAAIERKEITIDPIMALELSNSILIIDEMQMLYSSHGWNTYGLLLDHIRQSKDVRNLTTIMLSGTFLNSSPVEMIHLYNLIRERGTPRLELDIFFDKDMIGAQAYTYVPKKAKEEELTHLFDSKVVSYRISPSADFPEVHISGTLLTMNIKTVEETKRVEKKFEWLRLTRCRASQYQWEQYLASYETSQLPQPRAYEEKGEGDEGSGGGDEGEGDEGGGDEGGGDEEGMEEDDMMARDFALPAREEWDRYGVEPVKGSSEVYRGTWLALDNLRNKFGAIPAAFIQHLLDIVRSQSGEKVVAHHRRLERGGLMQYAEALKENGFTLFGEGARENAMCILCGKQLSLHASIESSGSHSSSTAVVEGGGSRAKKSITDHKFIPVVFAMLTGRISFQERQRIILTYNSSANLLNHRIMCLLLSGVGEKGITLKATNYAVALGAFPGVPAWRQFVSRIARHGTHRDLPPDKRWTDIYTMVLSPPVGSKELYSRDEFRYYIRESNDKEASRLWAVVRRRSVNCPFIPPENRGGVGKGDTTKCDPPMKVDHRERGRGDDEVGTDLHFFSLYQIVHIGYIRDVIRKMWSESPIWTLDVLRDGILSDRIRDVPHNMSYSTDVAICEAIVGLCSDQECQLLSVGEARDLSTLKSSMLYRSDIVLIAGTPRRGPRPYTIFTASFAHHGIQWAPIGREVGTQSEEELYRIVERIGTISGYRERLALFDRIIGKHGIVSLLRKDFELEGPLFSLLRRAQCIVWEGDDESHVLFAGNHLQSIEESIARKDPRGRKPKIGLAKAEDEIRGGARHIKPLKQIGFIIGNEYHSYKTKKWEIRTLPMYDASTTAQWKICAIFTPGSAIANGRWHIRTKIRPLPIGVDDMRRAQSGMACLSLVPSQIREYSTMLGIEEERGKTENCIILERALLQKQLTAEGKKYRFIYTPFESPPAVK